MTDILSERFAKKRPSPERLERYGFEDSGGIYSSRRTISDGEFELFVEIDTLGRIDARLLESLSGEEYTLWKTTAQGSFVTKIREEISDILTEISERCFESSPFRQEQTLRLISHAREAYRTEPEFLWESSPENAILRRSDSGKWYAALLTVSAQKLGLADGRRVEIVNLHASPEKVEELLTREGFCPAWHMSKRSWFTVILDGSVADAELFELADVSYRLAGRRK